MPTTTWTVQGAKAKLSEVIRKARAGEAQYIGMENPVVVVSAQEWEKTHPAESKIHFGRWLVENAPRGEDIELPPRTGTRRGNPFEE